MFRHGLLFSAGTPRKESSDRRRLSLSGACSSTTETDWEYLSRNNIGFSQTIWTWCAASDCPFYYASSASTYGDGSQGFDDRIPPEKLDPLHLYGKSKNEFDRWILTQIAEGRPSPSSWAGLKFFNVYGPREQHKGSMASVVWHARRQILETGEARLFKSNDPAIPDGGQRRDFVFVDDCIDHMLWLWQRPEVSGIFNSGTGIAQTFDDLVLAVFAALGREPKIRYIDIPLTVHSHYQNFTQAVMTKLRAAGYGEPPPRSKTGCARRLQPRQTPSIRRTVNAGKISLSAGDDRTYRNHGDRRCSARQGHAADVAWIRSPFKSCVQRGKDLESHQGKSNITIDKEIIYAKNDAIPGFAGVHFLAVRGTGGRDRHSPWPTPRGDSWRHSTRSRRHRRPFAFDSPERFNWHWIPRERKGLPIKALRPEQRALAFGLLDTGLSTKGVLKATTIMSLEEILRVKEHGTGPVRDPELYFVSIFGNPDDQAEWGWRVEGHHLVAQLHAARRPGRLGHAVHVRLQPRRGP